MVDVAELFLDGVHHAPVFGARRIDAPARGLDAHIIGQCLGVVARVFDDLMQNLGLFDGIRRRNRRCGGDRGRRRRGGKARRGSAQFAKRGDCLWTSAEPLKLLNLSVLELVFQLDFFNVFGDFAVIVMELERGANKRYDLVRRHGELRVSSRDEEDRRNYPHRSILAPGL